MAVSSDDRAQVQYMGTYVSTAPSNYLSPSLLTNCCSFRVPPSDPTAAPFRIPPLRSSFPSLLHPHYDLVKQCCDGWILDVARPPSAAACRLLLECVLPRLICRAIPAASSVARLIHVTKMIAWLTIADDDDDHPDALGADDNTSAQHASRVLAILHCKDEDSVESARFDQPVLAGLHDVFTFISSATGDGRDGRHNPVNSDSEHLGVPLYASCNNSARKIVALSALSQLWAEMRREMTPGLRDRFVLTMEDYFQAVKVQATFRKLHRLPDAEAYMEIRRQASFILPSFALLEYALGIELEEAAYSNPLVEKFRTLALDYICLCNDLVSCRAEIGVGDYFNMPSIAYNSSANKERSFQDAIDHVANMIHDIDAQCVEMLSIISQSLSSCVNTYIAALCSCMSGSLAWFLETARYRDFDSSSSSSSSSS